MRIREFRQDRSDALRKQLVDVPVQERRGSPQPSRRVLLALGAAWLAGQAPDQHVDQARPAAPSGTPQQTGPLQKVMPSPSDAYAGIPRSEIQSIGAVVDVLWDATDPYYGFNTVPVVARVDIDSIEGGRVFSPSLMNTSIRRPSER